MLGRQARRAAIALVPIATVLLGTGCGTVLSTMQPAQTTPGRHARGELGVGVGVPVGQIADTIQAAEDLAEGAATTGSITAVEDFLSGVVGLLMNPPTAAGELQGRYGISDRVDVGLRLATAGAFRLDGRFLMIKPEQPDGLHGSAGLGLTYASVGYSFPEPIDDFIEIDSVTRLEVDVPVLFGWSDDIYHVWFGPKLVVSSVSTGLTFRDEGRGDTSPETVDASAINVYYVAQVGGAIGYKYVWLALELTIGGISGGATIERNDAAMTKYEPSYGGVMVYPTLALLLQF